jgi:H+/Cl- antiporter ClcA
MNELDLLKKDWKRKEDSLPKLSYDEIYKMIWKKSSSIVKWIFYISIAEILVGLLFTIVAADKEYWQELDRIGQTEITVVTYLLSYLIVGYYIYLFYKNYKDISVTDSTRELMKAILKTRKTVKTYIAILLGISGIYSTLICIAYLRTDYITQFQENNNGVLPDYFWPTMIIVCLLSVFIALGVIWLFYKLLYGILLRKLLRNYNELKQMEI